MKTISIALLISAFVLPPSPVIAQDAICSDGRTVYAQCRSVFDQQEFEVYQDAFGYLRQCVDGNRGITFQGNPLAGEQCIAMANLMSALNAERLQTCMNENLCQ